MFCSRCGRETINGAAFCSGCGQRIVDSMPSPIVQPPIQHQQTTPQSTTPPPMPQQAPPQVIYIEKSRSSGWKTACIFLLVIVIVASVICFVYPPYAVEPRTDEQKISDLANTLEEAMNEGDFDKMISCFEPSAQNEIKAIINTANAFGKGVDIKDIWSIAVTEMADGNRFNICIYSITIDGSKGVVDLSINYGKQEDRNEVEVVKKGEKWYFMDDLSLF